MVPELNVAVTSYLLLAVPASAVVLVWWKRMRNHMPSAANSWGRLPTCLANGRLATCPTNSQGGRWSGGEVAVACLTIYLIGPVVVMPLLNAAHFFDLFYDARPHEIVQRLWAGLFALPLSLALVFLLLNRISQTGCADLGISPARWRENIGWGCAGFVLATPIVLGLFALLNKLPNVTPHPFAVFVQQRLTPLEWGLFFYGAVVYAPITEELIFRGLLQGWLRRASLDSHLAVLGIVSAFSVMSALPPESGDGFLEFVAGVNWWRLGFTAVLVVVYLGLLRRHAGKGLLRAEDPAQQPGNSGLAIVGSAMSFAFVHPPWPDPIALFLLGLILGWLASRTQSLLPGVLLHALFNAVAWLTLLLSRVWPAGS